MLVTGAKLGPYEIVSLVGSGGMGEVYRARDTRLDRTVAIKIISASHSSDGARRQRFEREARAISAIQHPNICTLYDIGRHDDADFLVMEYLEGETLASRLAKGRLPRGTVSSPGSSRAAFVHSADTAPYRKATRAHPGRPWLLHWTS